MSLSEKIRHITKDLEEGKFTSEAEVSHGIVMPLLSNLSWPIFNTSVVTPEYSVGLGRVDFALCHPPNNPAVFVEVKKAGDGDGADRQLFEYSNRCGVPIAIITDGQEWDFYLPVEKGRYDERRFHKFDLLRTTTQEVTDKLRRYLSYQRISSGKALEDARSDFNGATRSHQIQVAWFALVKEQDSLLVELLADKVEELFGYEPTLDNCRRFLKEQVAPLDPQEEHEDSEDGNLSEVPPFSESHDPTLEMYGNTFQGSYRVVFKGQTYKMSKAKEAYIKVFQLLAAEDPTFLERFAECKQGRTRKYLSTKKYELYPESSRHLTDSHSAEVVRGWWLMTNCSRPYMVRVIQLAREVVGPEISSKLEVDLGIGE